MKIHQWKFLILFMYVHIFTRIWVELFYGTCLKCGFFLVYSSSFILVFLTQSLKSKVWYHWNLKVYEKIQFSLWFRSDYCQYRNFSLKVAIFPNFHQKTCWYVCVFIFFHLLVSSGCMTSVIWDVRINDLLLWVLLGASAKFLPPFSNLSYFTSKDKNSSWPLTGEKMIWYNVLHENIYWYRI